MSQSKPTIQLGLRENWAQFSLLVLVNAFVGAMVGMERSILPVIAEDEFQLAARTAILSFIVEHRASARTRRRRESRQGAMISTGGK